MIVSLKHTLPFAPTEVICLGVVVIDLEENLVTEWMIQLILGTMIAIIAYFLKAHKTQQDKTNEYTQNQLTRIEKELHEHKLDTADRFVLKDDFIRATALTDRKLDKIYDEIIKLSKHTEGNV